MPTPKRYLELSVAADAEADELETAIALSREQIAELEIAAVERRKDAERYRRLAGVNASTKTVLTDPGTAVNTSARPMDKSQRVAISRAKRTKGDRISAAINQAELSKNDLAALVECSPAALSRYISGERRIPKATAEKIAKATGGRVPLSAWTNLATDDA